jgi:hypothetical protein
MTPSPHSSVKSRTRKPEPRAPLAPNIDRAGIELEDNRHPPLEREGLNVSPAPELKNPPAELAAAPPQLYAGLDRFIGKRFVRANSESSESVSRF